MDKQEQFLQERDAHLEMVEVFVTNGVTVYNNHYYSGNIYLVEKYKADSLINEGNAVKVSFPDLDRIKDKMEAKVNKLSSDVEKINNNSRLTPDAKVSDKAELVNHVEKELRELNDSYLFWVNQLLQEEKNKALDVNRNKDYDADKVAEKTGIIISEIEMSFSIDDAITKIEDHLEFIDESTSRRLLSQFTKIKAILEEKGKHTQNPSRKISKIYQKIKDASQNENQELATVKHRLLKTLKEKTEFSGVIPARFYAIKGRRY
ncbi:hypothetical protein [Oceanobacillus kimchii]|uniref:hypothetical protein n=1 Tax=Oceanobacillus kimchii TaxID=746691 RepID=UPI003B01A465